MPDAVLHPQADLGVTKRLTPAYGVDSLPRELGRQAVARYERVHCEPDVIAARVMAKIDRLWLAMK